MPKTIIVCSVCGKEAEAYKPKSKQCGECLKAYQKKYYRAKQELLGIAPRKPGRPRKPGGSKKQYKPVKKAPKIYTPEMLLFEHIVMLAHNRGVRVTQKDLARLLFLMHKENSQKGADNGLSPGVH